jgi:hypothetical protein
MIQQELQTFRHRSMHHQSSGIGSIAKHAGHQVLITVKQKELNPNQTVLLATLKRFTETGVELYVARPMAIDHRVLLSSVDEQQESYFDAVTENPKTRQCGDDSWSITCRLKPKLPSYLLDYVNGDSNGNCLLDSGLENTDGIPAIWRKADDVLPIRILSDCEDGLCVLSAASPEVTKPFCVSFKHPRKTTVVMETAWRIRLGDRWLIGSLFLLDEDRERFRALSVEARQELPRLS